MISLILALLSIICAIVAIYLSISSKRYRKLAKGDKKVINIYRIYE